MTTPQAHDGGLSTVNLICTQGLVASGTVTFAGVDLQDFIGDVKLILDVNNPTSGGVQGCQVSLLHSDDNTTYVTWAAAPTFALVTNTTALATATLDTRACKRYVQGKHVITGTTATFTTALIGVGTKQTQ
jgi:hypothetical protein